MTQTLENIVSAYGESLKDKLSSPAISGSPEDQLRGPLEALVEKGLAGLAGYDAGSVSLIGETSLADIKTRPDYAVTVAKALVGFIEVKAPGKGADPRKFHDPHDKDQWNKLKSLPNLLYTDGNSFALWRDGQLVGKVVHLEGDVESAGKKLAAPHDLVALFSDFLSWEPIPPKTARQLAEISARMCRLLRDEVTEQLERKAPGLTGLADDWRKLLFPQADDAQFADGYAQAVTFGLLIARARDIPLHEGIDHAASDLKKSSSLIGTALGLLTDDPANKDTLKTSLGTMARVLDSVNWHNVGKEDPEAWLYFYEHFLEVYDNALRKRTGSYYTPPEVVNAMVRLVDDVLRGPLFGRPAGFASDDVTVADPAVGTGTFLLGVLRRIAGTVSKDMGPGAVPGAIGSAANRLIGFELQFGPFAVAQLRLIAEYQELMKLADDKVTTIPDLKLFITDTLGNPFVEDEWLPQVMQPVAQSRRAANAIKKGQPITVVIGNPPYKEKAEGLGGWIEFGSKGLMPPLEWWRPPREWGIGNHTKKLKNLYVFFWRWASWKVFGSGHNAATGLPDKDEEGVVCYITVASFLNGPGFQKMRADLRASCSDIWVIDCTPEGYQPPVNTRIFQGVQQEVCIVIAARKLSKDIRMPARVRFRSLSKGRREAKFAELEKLTLDHSSWTECPDGSRDPFLPGATGVWAESPALKEFFIFDGPGVMPGRTWAVAPDKQSLQRRWSVLIGEGDPGLKEKLFHPQLRKGKVASRHIRKVVKQNLGDTKTRQIPLIDDKGPVCDPVRYGFRTLDRQWVIGDARVINDVRPELWNGYSEKQLFLTALDAFSPTSGPAVSVTALIPDQHHYKGSFGGRAFPLWRDSAATQSNVRPELLAFLAESYGSEVTPEDVFAYCAAVLAHPAFVARFADDLVQPGLRLPLTADADLFREAVDLGREVIWLHCYGERFDDVEASRPKAPPRMPEGEGPVIPRTVPFPARRNRCPMSWNTIRRRSA